MNKKIRYKVLKQDMSSPYMNFKFEINKTYKCENFDITEKECSNGFYATTIEGLVYAHRNGLCVYECEVWGKVKEFNIYKCRYEYIKITREIEKDELEALIIEEMETVDYDLYHIIFPIHPFNDIKLCENITDIDIENLKKLASAGASVRASVRASVWDSVGASVWASVRASVWDSVWASVRASVWDSVGASVWASVRAYVSFLFPNIEEWKYTDHKTGENPFQCGIDLWMRGLVPSFDGKTWRLHSGKSAKIVYEINKGELR